MAEYTVTFSYTAEQIEILQQLLEKAKMVQKQMSELLHRINSDQTQRKE